MAMSSFPCYAATSFPRGLPRVLFPSTVSCSNSLKLKMLCLEMCPRIDNDSFFAGPVVGGLSCLIPNDALMV